MEKITRYSGYDISRICVLEVRQYYGMVRGTLAIHVLILSAGTT